MGNVSETEHLTTNAPLASADLTTKKTFCRICMLLCGLDVVTDGKKVIRVLPDKTHPYNWRDYCAKGGNSRLVREHAKRIRTPMKRVGDTYVPVSYQQAVKEIAAQLNEIREKHGANAIATYIGNPGTTSASSNHFFQGAFSAAIGSFSNYTCGSLDHNGLLLVAQEMFGCQIVPLIPDVDHVKCFLFLGMNPAASGMSWIDTMPEGWKRVLAAKEKGADLIVVDPRQTPTTRKATTHVTIRPGEDWAFLLGIIKIVFENNWQHQQDCAEANGIETLKAIAAATSLEQLAQRCNVPATQIQDVARRFATAETAVCVARTGIAQNRNGTLGEWLHHALNLITGRIDRKGGRYYQPGVFKNSMQVVNMLAPPVDRRSRIGGYKSIGGGYPITTLPDEIRTPGEGQVRALIINAGNPVPSAPDGARMDAAFKELDCLIAVDMFQRESHRHAHWLIPGTHFLERDEFFLSFSTAYEIPFAQLGQAAIEPLNGIKPEWEFFRDLTVEMKVPFMGMPRLNTLIKVSRWVSRLTGNPRHAFNPRWVWAFMIKKFGAVDWKTLVKNPQGFIFGEKTYGHLRPSLQTKDGRINAAPDDFVAALKQRLAEPLPQPDNVYPFRFVSQRRESMMNTWLVETTHHTRPYGDVVDINPADALANKIQDGQAVALTSRIATIQVKARVTDEVPVGILSMDHGWGSRLFDPQGGAAPEVSGVMRNLLVPADDIDELAGIPSLHSAHVSIAAVA